MHQPVVREIAVIDASFWINAERSGLLEYLPDFFVLKAPAEVAREITATAVFLYDQGRLTHEQTQEILQASLAARRVVREAVIVLAALARERRFP